VSKARNALFCWRSNEHACLTLRLCTEGKRAAIGPFSSGLPFGSFRSKTWNSRHGCFPLPLPVRKNVEFQLRYYLNVGMDVSMLVCKYVFMCKYVEIYVETRGGGVGGECVWRNA
jgi:hypothetical protein